MNAPRSFREFYPIYLAAHQHRTCRRLHVIGTGGVMALLASAAVTGLWVLAVLAPVVGYGFAWLGHFAFERNRPAAFGNPLWSLFGDFVMFADVCRGRIQW
jgi:hypothetical protein